MEKRINIAELLKDCQKGMELDSPMYDNVTFGCIVDGNCYPVQVQTPEGNMLLSQHGCTSLSSHAKCVIFPKGKTTWEGFVPPCQFKDGDILYVDTNDNDYRENCFKYVFIFKEMCEHKVIAYCYISANGCFKPRGVYLTDNNKYPIRYATEDEKEKLFDAIKTNGYRWNMKTKTLEKLIPKFKIGDKIRYKNGKNINGIEQGVILSITDGNYDIAVTNNMGVYVPIEEQDDWEAIPYKFDIRTLKPFESKVLVRNDRYSVWKPSFWGLYDKGHKFPYVTTGCRYRQCIPYKDNEYLLGKADMCDDYYKNW